MSTAILGGFLALASAAWACTDFTKIDSVTPVANPSAATAMAAVKGSGASAGSTVEVRWNSLNGPVIARTQADASGAFSADAAVPHVPAGMYTVVATDGKTDAGRASYEVAATTVGATPNAVNADFIPPAKTSAGFAQPSNTLLPSTGVIGLAAGLLAAAFALVTIKRRRVLATR